jgi:hypothetical protein
MIRTPEASAVYGHGVRKDDGEFRPTGKSLSFFRIPALPCCPALRGKTFLFRFSENNALLSPFRSRHKGRIAVVTNVERNAVDGNVP